MNVTPLRSRSRLARLRSDAALPLAVGALVLCLALGLAALAALVAQLFS